MNPFDLKAALLARHGQHVVLIHFPIALFITGAAFDVVALWRGSRGLATAAYYNLLAAAVTVFPAVATGLLAWQLQLGGAKLKGTCGCICFWLWRRALRFAWCGASTFGRGAQCGSWRREGNWPRS